MTVALSSSSSNTNQSSIATSSTTLASAAATSTGNAGKFLSGPFKVSTAFGPAKASAAASSSGLPSVSPSYRPSLNGKPLASPAAAQPTAPPTVNCPSASCDSIGNGAGGALTNPLGLNVVDMANSYGPLVGDPTFVIEPPDQGLCANSNYVMEILNIGEVQLYSSTTLNLVSNGYAILDNLMGLPSHGASGWSSGGDISCLYDSRNGGHWFITEFVSTTPEMPLVAGGQPGPFQGCFVGVANTCREGIAVSVTNNPMGAYNVYFLNPNKVNGDPGAGGGFLLNDFAKIGSTNDAFLMSYDEFNLNAATYPTCPAFGCFGFNGAQQFAFSKNALEKGLSAKNINVAYENMGKAKNLYPIPANGVFQPAAGSCFSGALAGGVCWFQVIPAQSPDASQYDNHNGGTGFMMAALDVFGGGDDRIAVFDWTGLSDLNSASCSTCGGIQFGGQIFVTPVTYKDFGLGCFVEFGGQCGLGVQKAGPIPLGNNCYLVQPTTNTCPESGIATNGDGVTQASFADGELWTAVATQVVQTFGASSEMHVGATFWAIGTSSFDSKGTFSLTNDGYVSPAHADISMPAMAGGDSPGAVLSFTLSGKAYYPSSAYGTLTTASSGLVGGVVHITALGKSPQDGFSEYQGFPGAIRPRWGDYGWAIFVPSAGPGSTGGVYFATEYIQHPNCGNSAFISSGGTCGGTRTPFANWGSSINFVASP